MLIKEYPEGVGMKDQNGRTPLHVACQYNPSLVELLNERYPEAARVKDVYGSTPLHLACRFGNCLLTIELLFESYADAIREKDHAGFTPLHLVSIFHPSETEVIMFLIKMDPESLLRQDFSPDV